MIHHIFEIAVDSFSFDSMAVGGLLYFVVGLLGVFDIDSQSNTPLHEHFHNGGQAEASPFPLHYHSHLIALPVSTQAVDCPAPVHAATG
jgi:hypothetical protein